MYVSKSTITNSGAAAWFIPLVVAASLLPAADTQGQKTSSDALATKLAEICREHKIPALAAAAVNADGLIESACFGVRKRGSKDKVATTDRFALASNTKAITATVAAAMVEAGRISWDTTIGEVWPKASDKDIHPRLRDIDLDDLLSHQSGLPKDFDGPEWRSFFDEDQSPVLERRRLLKLVLSKPPAGARKKFEYSNLGYMVVGAMLETRAKEPFEALAKEHVFDPLGMKSARFHSLKTAKKMKPPFLWGHDDKGKPFNPRVPGTENPTAYAPGGTVQLAIDDYAKFAAWHLKGVPAPVLKTQGAFDHLHEPLAEFDASGAKYACGWISFKSGFGPTLQHAGSNTNSFALIWMLPESNVAAMVCTNTGEPQAFAACDAAIAHLLVTHRAADH